VVLDVQYEVAISIPVMVNCWCF